MKFKYVIVSPRQEWGGAIVLHVLCKHLNEMGYDARIFYTNKCAYVYKRGHHVRFWIKWIIFSLYDFFNEYNGKRLQKKGNLDSRYDKYVNPPIKNCKRKIFPFIGKNTIVVYPESIYGNFLHSKHVVRWLLYHNIYESLGGSPYDKSDLFFAYRDIFNDFSFNPSNRKLYVAYYDLETYKQYNFGERQGNCYVIRKGRKREDLPQTFDGPIVDELTETEKVKVFNKSKYCISYDTQTAYSMIAALCGCISVVMPEEGKGREDYRQNETSYGEAFGFSEEEIQYSISTRGKLREMYEQKNKDNIIEVENFVNECEKHFGKEKMR